MEDYGHKTVLLEEAVNSLNICSNGIYIDGTFGCGGHSRLILSQLGKRGRLLAIDRDPYAISIANNINDSRFSIIQGPFSCLDKYITKYRLIRKINGILFDLGVSSPQIDNAERGFSFIHNGPIDMRMDPTHGQSAAEWLHTANESNISWVLKNFGEERFSKKIARAIVQRNHINPIIYTKELAEIIISTVPVKYKHKHPATRTFQAIRILINNELKEIELALNSSLNLLAVGGRIVVISFHSLEDRIVKHFMRKYACNLNIPINLPITEVQIKKLGNCRLKILGKLIPSKKEIAQNPRARSAVLRVAEKIDI